MASHSPYDGEERRSVPREPGVARALPDESLHDVPLDEHGRPLSRQRKRKAARRALKIVAGLVGGVVVLAAGAVLVLTNTNWGRERVRRQALALLQKQVHGRVRIGAIHGNLLTGATIDNLVITDSAGNPFVAAERVKARYSLSGILDKKLVFSDVELLRPVIVLDRPPDAQWNWKRIFAKKDKPATPADTTLGYGDWVSFENMTLVEGRLIVRTPWKPSAKLATQAQRDSVTREALAGGSRNRVIQVAGGYQKVMDFRSLDGRFPLLRIKDPQHQDMLVRVASANAILAMFLPPEGDLRDVAGDFRIWGDSLTFQGVRAAFPGSRVTGSGRYLLTTSELQLAMKGAPAALPDFRWAYPRLPSQGGGTLGFNMHWVEGPKDSAFQRYEMVDADVRVGKSHLVGDLGFTLTDTVAFHGTQLRVTDFDTRLMEQLIAGFKMPVNGTATGRLALGGGLADLHLDTDLAFNEAKTGTSRAEVKGVIGFGKEGFVKAQGLRMRLYPLQVGLANVFLPKFPLGGTLTGLLTLDGTPANWLASSADVVHTDLGQSSHIVGRASMGFGAFPGRALASVDADVHVSPLALAPTIGRYAPSAGFRGAAAGSIQIKGPLSNLRFATALRTTDGGALRATGNVDVAARQIGYNLRAGFDVFDASVLVASMPKSSLSLDLAARGRGTDPATMTSDVALGVRASRWNQVAVDSAQLAASVAGGILTLDTLRVAGPGVQAGAGGHFGLVADHRGELSYAVAVDSLGALRRWIPVDSGGVAPRPAVVQQALARARGDSTRLARATEAERAVTGTPMPKVVVDTPKVVKRDSLAGRVWAAGRVVGTLKDFDARGRLGAQGVVWNGSTVGAARVEYAWTGAPGTNGSIVVGADLDTVRAAGFDLERVETRVAYGMQLHGGRMQLLLRQAEGKEYAAHADYRIHPDHRELHLDDLRLRFDTTTWASAGPGDVHWGARGIEVNNIDLRHGPTGRVYVDGFIPRSTGTPASLEAMVTDFEIGDVVTLAQSDLDAHGKLSLGAKFEGTLADPRFTGAVGILDPVYRGTALPQLRTAFAYDGTRLTAQAQALQDARVIALAEGRVAIRLGSGGTGPRLPKDTPLEGLIVADSLPLEALPKFTDVVSNVQGRAIGRITIAGTVGKPRATGALALDLGGFRVVPSGTRFTRLAGRLRLLGDSIVVDTLGGFASGGPVSLEGGVGIADISRPSFDLRLTTHNARLLDNDQGKVTADVEGSIYGPYNAVYVNGRVRVREGVIYLPENNHREVISSGDPALFAVADTSAQGSDDELLPAQSSLLKNLRMSIGLLVDRNTWVRSTEANVEIFSEDWLRISVNRASQSLVLDGVLSTERGEYTFLSKRFQIRRGSATFVGTPDLNPTVQATAEYEVNVPAREALFIRLLIGGTVRAPRLSLESNSQPPISQSDLLSYLAFGRSSSSLLQMGGSGLGSGGSGGLAGATGALARNQITGIALGVAVDELERGFARRASLDVFNITPAPDVQTEILGGNVSAVARSTEVEAGRYWNQSRLFTAAQVRLGSFIGSAPVPPGLTVQYRLTPQLRIETSLTPRYLLQTPTLEQKNVAATSVLGLFLIREWRF